MEITAITVIAAKQASTQLSTALSIVKMTAQAEQGLVNVIAQSSPGARRGQLVDLSV